MITSTILHNIILLLSLTCVYTFFLISRVMFTQDVWSEERSRESNGDWPAASESRDPGAETESREIEERLRDRRTLGVEQPWGEQRG